jgi:hypothetical protein
MLHAKETLGRQNDNKKAKSNPFTFLTTFRGTVSCDRFQKFGQKFTELGVTEGCGLFLNFLRASIILKYKNFIYCSNCLFVLA